MTSADLRNTAGSATVIGSVLVVGPGWLGAPLARQLAERGANVFTLQRSAATNFESRGAPDAARITAISGDLGSVAMDASALATLRSQLPAQIDHLIVCIAPSRARGDDYGIYPRAARGATALASAMGTRHLLYVSSTGVYDRHDGSVVTEESIIEPGDARVQALYDAEQAISAAGDDGIAAVHIVRAAGLYGPQRDPAARLADPAFASANVWCNFSWRDDVIAAITHLSVHDLTPGVRTFNCADGTPLRSNDITATVTGRPVATTTLQSAESNRNAPVRSGRSNQRISVDALLATGWRPVVPTVYDGLRLLGHTIPYAPATAIGAQES